jgi:hypothetical protein
LVALLVRLVWCPLPPVVDPGHISRDGFTRFARVFRRELKITGAASAFSFVWWWLVPDHAICHGLEAGNGKARHGSGSGWVCGSGSRMSAHSRERTVARPTHRSAAAAARGAVGTYAAADWQCTRPRPLLSCCHLRCACARDGGLAFPSTPSSTTATAHGCAPRGSDRDGTTTRRGSCYRPVFRYEARGFVMVRARWPVLPVRSLLTP